MTDDQIVEMVLRHEGVWDNNPADSGGKTAYGISSRYHPEAWVNGPPTREQAIAIYLKDYVAPFASVDPEHKPQVVDIAVNSGVTTARALYAVARANHGSRSVTTQLAIERLKHYARIVKAKPTQSQFLLGWIARAVSFLTVLLLCASPLYAQDGRVDHVSENARDGHQPDHRAEATEQHRRSREMTICAGSECAQQADRSSCKPKGLSDAFIEEVLHGRVKKRQMTQGLSALAAPPCFTGATYLTASAVLSIAQTVPR